MLFRRNLLRQGRDKGLRRPDPPDPFRKTGQLLPRLAKSTGNVRFPTIPNHSFSQTEERSVRFSIQATKSNGIRQSCWLFVATSDRVWLWKMRVPTNCPKRTNIRPYRVCRNDRINITFGEKSDESISVHFADFRASLAGYLLH